MIEWVLIWMVLLVVGHFMPSPTELKPAVWWRKFRICRIGHFGTLSNLHVQRCSIAVPGRGSDKRVMRVLFSIGWITTLLVPAPANALCFYTKADLFAGKARSYTTIPQEFRDLRWVVRARVISARYHSTDDDSWTVYTIRVLDRFKGSSIHTMRVFTYHDSGGFHLDKGLKAPDRANDYLLFLNPAS